MRKWMAVALSSALLWMVSAAPAAAAAAVPGGASVGADAALVLQSVLPAVSPALRAFYESHNEALADLLDEDARWTWRDVYAKAERTTDKNA